jgi:MutS-like protein
MPTSSPAALQTSAVAFAEQHAPTPSASADPASEYQRRLAERTAALAQLRSYDSALAVARGLTFLAAVAAALYWYLHQQAPAWPTGLFLAVFVVLVLVHQAAADRLDRARLAVDYYKRCLDRLADCWSGRGTAGLRYLDRGHLYADDLDLFGRGSLFELLCQARTRLGEDVLAQWLCAPADAATIRRRQEAVEELRGNADLREKIALLRAEVHEDLDQNRLIAWSQERARPVSGWIRVGAVLLALLSLAALTVAATTDVGAAPFLLTLIIDGVVSVSYGRKTRRLARTADEAASGLAILSQVLAIIEGQRFRSTLLVEISRRLETKGLPPSRQIARLERLIDYMNNSLRNQFFVPIAFVLRLPVHLVHAIETWRARLGPHIPDWLRAVGEFEALACLSGFAFDHPDYPFPKILESGTCFDGRQLGHPLIPAGQCVRNDLRLDDETRLVLISGSNMSGKSTMLRSVGTNLVLALAGAPIRAQSLTVSVLQMGTAMRIRDSLQSGESLFYAAVSRLKAVVDRAQNGTPLLFLFDEILQGTNSHDRLVGSEGVLRALVERGAVGLTTTHDLALTQIVQGLGSRGVNVHFEDSLVDGKMSFDYRIRPGVVQKSNALEIMRLMGLDV